MTGTTDTTDQGMAARDPISGARPVSPRTAASEWTRLLVTTVAAALAAGCLALPFTLPGSGPTVALAGPEVQFTRAKPETASMPPTL